MLTTQVVFKRFDIFNSNIVLPIYFLDIKMFFLYGHKHNAKQCSLIFDRYYNCTMKFM